MKFNKHTKLEGKHALLSASSNAWLNDSNDKFISRFYSAIARARGTKLHDLADKLIELGEKLPESTKTLNQYVNDAIGFGMKSEVLLYYSDNCFGTADAIKFDNQSKILRIHDLKTGEVEASFTQLEIYAAIFCYEYDINPNDITIYLRIYQHDDYKEIEALGSDIIYIQEKIRYFDLLTNKLKEEVNG